MTEQDKNINQHIQELKQTIVQRDPKSYVYDEDQFQKLEDAVLFLLEQVKACKKWGEFNERDIHGLRNLLRSEMDEGDRRVFIYAIALMLASVGLSIFSMVLIGFLQ